MWHINMEIQASDKVHTHASQPPLSSLEFAAIISFTLRVVLGLVQSFRNHSFTQVMAFAQSDLFIWKSQGEVGGFMRLVTCSAWVTEPKRGSPGRQTGKPPLTGSASLSEGLWVLIENGGEKSRCDSEKQIWVSVADSPDSNEIFGEDPSLRKP